MTEIVEFLDMEQAVINDAPGFATSRLGVLVGLEAIRMVEQGVASAADIDRAMSLGYRHPMGPLMLGDLVGLDVRLGIAKHLATVYGERFEPPELQDDGRRRQARQEVGARFLRLVEWVSNSHRGILTRSR